jgi:hypothetical protein
METEAHFAERLLVRLGGVVGVIALMLALAPAAVAAPPPAPGQIAAIDQYYETFPTSSGGRLSGRGAAPAGGGTPLPPALEARIREQAGPDAQTLIDLAATSPAPVEEDAAPEADGDASEEASEEPATTPADPEEPSFAEALTEATGAPASSRGWLLLAVVLATTAALAAVALRQRRAAAERD